MERVNMEQLFQLIGTERCNRILKVMSREAKVDGFRKGKVPASILQSVLKTPGIPQQHFFMLVIKDYFPDFDPITVDPDTLSDSSDILPAKIAAYALRGREHQIVWPHEESSTDINSHNNQDDNTTSNSNEHLENPEPISDFHMADTDLLITHDTIGQSDIPDEVEERQATRLSTRYLGYVQVVLNTYNNTTFYNFHPTDVLDDTNQVFVLDAEEVKALFRDKGNINIYARYRDNALLEDQFGNGGIYIIDLDESLYEDNIRGGVLNQTNKKIPITALIETEALSFLAHCHPFIVNRYTRS